ncbi:MAG: cytochrome-c peroxidase [Flavobacteriales bacterium]
MKKTGFVLAGIALFFLSMLSLDPIWDPPKDWPEPSYDFEQNPLTAEGVEWGRYLFYDPILSRDSSISCASCHLSFTAFTHVDHGLSHGIEDRIGRRNSPALMNLAWSEHLMWDGAVHHLDFQPLLPIQDSTEMDHDISLLVEVLNQTASHKGSCYKAFGDSVVTGERLLKALSQFQLTLISANSKYDQVTLGVEGVQFTKQENQGYKLFTQNCASCHTAPLFTNGDFENGNVPINPQLNDLGRFEVSKDSSDLHKFKVPTLRNIEFSKPYMHDGSIANLTDALDHMSPSRKQNEMASEYIQLSSDEKVDLMAFLLTLTDKEFLFNPDFGFPRKELPSGEGY